MMIVRRKDLIEILGISESTLDRLIKSGRFPRPMRISARAVGWPRDQVEAWIAEQSEKTADRLAG